MIIALGCDHAGFPLKARLMREVERAGHSLVDCGVFDETPVDYPDIAREVGDAVRQERASRGLIVCGSGVGVSIAANKLQGVRAALCHDTFSARQGVEDDALNVLCLGARVIGPELAADVVGAFLRATFSGEERHVRRLNKVEALERQERMKT